MPLNVDSSNEAKFGTATATSASTIDQSSAASSGSTSLLWQVRESNDERGEGLTQTITCTLRLGSSPDEPTSSTTERLSQTTSVQPSTADEAAST